MFSHVHGALCIICTLVIIFMLYPCTSVYVFVTYTYILTIFYIPSFVLTFLF